MIRAKLSLVVVLAVVLSLSSSIAAAGGQVITEFTAQPVGVLGWIPEPPTVTGGVIHFPHTMIVRVNSDNPWVAGAWTNHADPCILQPDKGTLGPCHGTSHIVSDYGGIWDGIYNVKKHVRPFDPDFVDKPWVQGICHGSGAFEGMTMQMEGYFLPNGQEIYRGRILGTPR